VRVSSSTVIDPATVASELEAIVGPGKALD
jgi:hypothetical protein